MRFGNYENLNGKQLAEPDILIDVFYKWIDTKIDIQKKRMSMEVFLVVLRGVDFADT